MISLLYSAASALAMPLNTDIQVENTPRVFGLDIERNDMNSERHLSRRDAESMGLKLQEIVYTTNLKIGSPATEQQFVIDTGSSDLWVNANTTRGPYYLYNQSNLFQNQVTDRDFKIVQGGKTKAKGFWGADQVSVFDKNIEAIMGVANVSTWPQTLGLGPKEGESFAYAMSTDQHMYPTYDNFPALLKKTGVIGRNAFSLWLEGASRNGSLLFGGIDHSKYEGNLTTVRMVDDFSLNYNTTPRTLSVVLDNIKLPQTTFNEEVSAPVLLNSGNPVSYLPASVVDALASELGAQKSSELGMYIANCNTSGQLQFNFSGAVLPVEIPDLLLPIRGKQDPIEKCVLAVDKHKSGPLSLGNTFLRNVYAVFDLEDNQVALARAVNASNASMKQSDVEEILTGIPGSVQAPNYNRTTSL